MPEKDIPVPVSTALEAQRSVIARCEEVLFQSCNAELRLAGQFCRLAEIHFLKHHTDRAARLLDAAEKALNVAGKHAKDPEQRRIEVAGIAVKVSDLRQRLREELPRVNE